MTKPSRECYYKRNSLDNSIEVDPKTAIFFVKLTVTRDLVPTTSQTLSDIYSQDVFPCWVRELQENDKEKRVEQMGGDSRHFSESP